MRDPTGSAVKSAVAAHTWEIKRCGINQTWPHTHTALIHTQAASNIVTMKSNQALAWRPALGSSPALTPQLCSAANCGHTKSWPKAKTTARQAPPTPHPPKTPKAPIQNCCLILLRKSLTHARLQLVTGHAGHTLNRSNWSCCLVGLVSSLWGPICGPSSSANFPISEMFNGPANGNGKRPAATAAETQLKQPGPSEEPQLSWIFPATICANLLA